MRRGRQFQWYIIFLLLSLAVLIFGISDRQKTAQIQQQVVEFSSPLLYALRQPLVLAWAARDWAKEHWAAVEQNKIIKQENLRLREWKTRAEILMAENAELQQLLSMTAYHGSTPLAARVLADSHSPYAESVIIDVGRKDGVRAGQAVMVSEGLVGRVIDVSAETSRVLLITDYNSRIPVKLLNGGEIGILHGGKELDFRLTFSDDEATLIEDSLLYTSGAGGIFEQGLPVAIVRAGTKGLKIEPTANLRRLDKVIVQLRPVEGVIDPQIESCGNGG